MDSDPGTIIHAAAVAGHPGADAVRLAGERVVAVGPLREVRRAGRRAGQRPEQLLVPGGLICPGFHDAHVHLGLAAGRRREIELRGLGTDGVCAALGAALEPERRGRSAWIVGGGLDPAATLGANAVPADVLERAAPGRPVLLRTHDYHGVHVSRTALERLRPALEGVRPEHVLRDDGGEPTGVLLEAAALAAEAIACALDDRTMEREITRFVADLATHGITAVHEMSGARDRAALGRLDARGELLLDVFATLGPEETELPAPSAGGRLHVVALKAFLDGSLGSRTARLLEPYEGEAADGHRGLEVTTAEAALAAVRRAAALGVPSWLHAIGDAAVRTALDVLSDVAAPGDVPHRVEHAQMIHDDDLPRFAGAGIVASLQPVHIRVDAALATRHWGRRTREAFPLWRLLDSGATVALGSDAPVETPDPLEGLRAAVDRRGADGTELAPAEAVTPAECIDGYTRGAAHAVGRASDMGRIAPGAVGSLTVLSRDVIATPAALADCRIAATVVRGALLHADTGAVR